MRARRSCLSVPARPPAKLAKAPTLDPDEVIVDLEDAVPPSLKAEARGAVAEALAGEPWVAPGVSVRINPLTTPWGEADMESILGVGKHVDSLVVPKVERPADVRNVEELIAGMERRGISRKPVGIQVLIETALGLRNVGAIAEASPRLEALILGPADMSVSLGFPSPDDGGRWDFVRGLLLLAARAAGIQAIDGPFLRVRDPEGLVDSATRARDLGFDGKWALHPAQIEPLNRIFTPTQAEIDHAAAVLDTLAGADGAGAVLLEGEMIDEASRKRAEQVLARARRGGHEHQRLASDIARRGSI